MATTTWKPHTEHGELSGEDRRELPDEVYAFPEPRKEPLTDARRSEDARRGRNQEGLGDGSSLPVMVICGVVR